MIYLYITMILQYVTELLKTNLCFRDKSYMVSVDIDKVPLGHHDVPCQEPTEQSAINTMNELIKSQENEDPIPVVNVDHQEKANGELDSDFLS
jgi:hypothetical protein